MKFKLLLFSIFSSLAITAGATTQNITVQDFNFNPSNVTIQLGDTIKFTWVNGSHTTTSTTIPAGAATWDRPMNAANTTFTYVPTVAGLYNYKCTPHEAMGHIGRFTVNGGTGISNYDFSKIVFDLYPNPAQDVLHIAIRNGKKAAGIVVADITGKQVLSNRDVIAEKMQLDISSLTSGVYFIRLEQDGKTYVRKFTVTR